MKINQDKSILLIVDVQNDFLEGGALEVADSNSIIPIINKLQLAFDNVVATQDWHPNNHKSFASQHRSKSVGEFIELNGIRQILWPDHCVQNTFGSEFSKKLDVSKIKKIIKKGSNPEIDSYSGFFENDRKTKTNLEQYLRAEDIENVFVCGLATDYCVKFTALDSQALGFNTFLIEDAIKGVNINANDSQEAVMQMLTSGVKVIQSNILQH